MILRNTLPFMIMKHNGLMSCHSMLEIYYMYLKKMKADGFWGRLVASEGKGYFQAIIFSLISKF